MDRSKVTVCICTLNERHNIVDAVRYASKCFPSELMVVDGGSIDGTQELALEMGVQVVSCERGLAGQRQKGIELCQTDYIFFVDADDRLAPDCLEILLEDMAKHGYHAVQARLRVFEPRTYWQKAMDAVLRYCICIPGPSKMVGRPALYRMDILEKVGMDTSFNNVGNEDAALSIRMEKAGSLQGVGHGASHRLHPATWQENFRAWKKYGRGDAQLIRRYPSKIVSVLRHQLWNYPILRSLDLIRNGESSLIGYTLLMGWTRFLYMLIDLVVRKFAGVTDDSN